MFQRTGGFVEEIRASHPENRMTKVRTDDETAGVRGATFQVLKVT